MQPLLVGQVDAETRKALGVLSVARGANPLTMKERLALMMLLIACRIISTFCKSSEVFTALALIKSLVFINSF